MELVALDQGDPEMSAFPAARQFIARHLGIDEGDIEPGSTLASLRPEPLAAIALVFAVEAEFGVRLSYEDLRARTLGELADLVERQLAGKERPFQP
jgi:acyl carrier protein